MKTLFAMMLLVALLCFGAQAHAQSNVKCAGCVDTKDIASGAVTTGRIENKAVTTSKIDARAVNASKLANRAVTTNKIKDGAVTVDKVSPELSNSIGTYCAPGYTVYGMNDSGNFACEPASAGGGAINSQKVSNSASGVASVSCPSNSTVVSANCDCDYVNDTRNWGFLFGCQVAGNGGVVGCFADSFAWVPFKPEAWATVTVVCLSQGTTASAGGASLQGVPTDTELDIELSAALKRMQDQALDHSAALHSR
jgi:hypothetical protein